MQRRAPKSKIVLSGPIKYSIIITILGVVGLLAITQWTAYSVRKHINIASVSIFRAALNTQRARTSFERMNREYSDAVVMQEKAALANADQEAATVASSLDSAAKFMEYNSVRHQQIVALKDRITDLRARSEILYASATESNAPLPKQEDLANLSHENLAIRTALEALQGQIANDFRAEQSIVDKLLKLQNILQFIVLAGVAIALFFSIRALINLTVRMREDVVVSEAHLELENERRVLRALIDNVPDFMYVKDIEGRFLLANASLVRLNGAKTPEEMVGKTDFYFYPQEMATAFYEDEQKIIRSGQSMYNREEECLDHAGNTSRVLTTKVLLRDGNGKVIGIAGIGRDITVRKHAEDSLREAERKYRGIVDNAIIGIFQSTPGGRTLSVNPAMARIYGYDSPEEMLTSVADIARQAYVDPKRREEFKRLMETQGGVQNFEFEALRKNGSKSWISMSAVAIRERGLVVRYEGMIQDITERNALRDQLLQAQKLESIGQLAAGIAHEINTPIQYIGDNVRFLKDAFLDLKNLLVHYEMLLLAAKNNALSDKTIQEVAAAADGADTGYLLDEIPKAIDQSLEGVTRVAALVSAMKEFSHPDTKEKLPLDLNHAINSTITVARNEWKYVSNMETEFDPTMPPIYCLPGEFNQVILNLIVNAAHAIADVIKKGGPEKGKITIQTQNCPEWAEIRIQDTGSGIPENIQSRIFDPFFTTKEIGKGTGQGLSIARSVIVDKHGGSIHFETEEGKGTTFIIRLPKEPLNK
jgi:PAS domain S-box-containing protein